VAGRPLRRNGRVLRPVGMGGWSSVVFARDDDSREVIPLDDLVEHLDEWERK
jgi:hypothetical protein